MTDPHQTVLLAEAVSALITNRGGTYVDCTYGRGGHSQAIVNALAPDGRLLVVAGSYTLLRAHATASFLFRRLLR